MRSSSRWQPGRSRQLGAGARLGENNSWESGKAREERVPPSGVEPLREPGATLGEASVGEGSTDGKQY